MAVLVGVEESRQAKLTAAKISFGDKLSQRGGGAGWGAVLLVNWEV